MVPSQWIDEVLAEHPALRHKLKTFSADYELLAAPALVLQCRTIAAKELAVLSSLTTECLYEGVRQGERHGAWRSFASEEQPVPTFEGIAAFGDKESGWSAEFHSDGHVIAGIWEFDAHPYSDGAPSVAPIHRLAFEDFGALCARLLGISQVANEPLEITCTLLNASQLVWVKNTHAVPGKATKRHHLQWRVRQCASADELDHVTKAMGRELARAFGQKA